MMKPVHIALFYLILGLLVGSITGFNLGEQMQMTHFAHQLLHVRTSVATADAAPYLAWKASICYRAGADVEVWTPSVDGRCTR